MNDEFDRGAFREVPPRPRRDRHLRRGNNHQQIHERLEPNPKHLAADVDQRERHDQHNEHCEQPHRRGVHLLGVHQRRGRAPGDDVRRRGGLPRHDRAVPQLPAPVVGPGLSKVT
jgi:hypothetical protein